MIGAVHAAIGAAIGSLFKSKSGAFAAGVASHAVADALPHKDFDPKTEAALLAGAMTAIGVWKGADSPEFAGAVGAVIPDGEHALSVAGLIRDDHKLFPTHIHDGKYHGPRCNERWSQLLIAAAAVVVLAAANGRKSG